CDDALSTRNDRPPNSKPFKFRIVFDRETGNPKGYGFAEYAGKKKQF
ncbi:unnamed protein product, partial [Rotaria sp. Silwood1]